MGDENSCAIKTRHSGEFSIVAHEEMLIASSAQPRNHLGNRFVRHAH